MSKVRFDIILSIPFASLVPLPLLNQNWSSPSASSICLSFPLLSIVATIFVVCMCDEVDCMMAAALCSFWLLLKGNHGNFSEILEQFSSFLYFVESVVSFY
jgi:hypothetical protein